MKPNILFITLVKIDTILQRGIYTDLIRKLSNEGFSVYVVCPLERKFNETTKLIVEKNVKILQVKTPNIQKTNVIEKAIATITLEYLLLRAINKHFVNVDINLILYATPPITLTNIINKLKNKHNAITYLLLKDIFPQNAVDIGMIKGNSLIYKYFRKKEKKLYQLSDTIGCMSPKNIKYVLQHNPELAINKIEHNPNSIDIESIPKNSKKMRSVLGLPENSTILLYGGNLGKPQGIDFLIKVLESNRNRNDCFFVIVGDGTEFYKINNWIKSKQPTNIILKKTLGKADYDILVSNADIGLLFLDNRFTIPNFPSRILSYMESKLPVLMATDNNTDIGSIAVENKFGLWSESTEVETFNRNLNYLINNIHERIQMGINGYKFMIDHYSVDVSFNKIEEKLNALSCIEEGS